MTISFSKGEVQKIASSFTDAIDNLSKVHADLDEVGEDFHRGVPHGQWSTQVTQEAESIASDAVEIISDLKSEIKGLQDNFSELSVAVMRFIQQNSELEENVIDAIGASLPDGFDGSLENINPLGERN